MTKRLLERLKLHFEFVPERRIATQVARLKARRATKKAQRKKRKAGNGEGT